jgi:large subunit ribosomal protein L19
MAAETKKKDNREVKEKKVVIKKEPIPQLAAGDNVKVSMRIVEGDKERIQMFQGVVIKIHNSADGGNFTVRRVAYGVGVERTFPFASPLVARVELVRHGKVRRARLFYLRNLSGKAARIKEKRMSKEKLALIEAAGASEIEEAPVMEASVAEVPAAPETEIKAE